MIRGDIIWILFMVGFFRNMGMRILVVNTVMSLFYFIDEDTEVGRS